MDTDRMAASELQAKVLANQLLTMGAQKGSAGLDTFSGWLLAGFGAGFALIYANLDSVVNVLSIGSLRLGTLFFLASVAFAVVAKLLGAFVASGAGAAIEGGELGRRLAEQRIDIDFRQVFREAEAAAIWPGSILMNRMFAAAEAGDLTVVGRMYAKAGQLQGAAVLAQALSAVAAGVALICGLGV